MDNQLKKVYSTLFFALLILIKRNRQNKDFSFVDDFIL